MNYLAVVATVVAIAASAGGVAGFFKASRGDTIIKLLKEESGYWKERSARYEGLYESAEKEIEGHKQTVKDVIEHAQGNTQLLELTKQIKNLAVYVKESITKERER